MRRIHEGGDRNRSFVWAGKARWCGDDGSRMRMRQNPYPSRRFLSRIKKVDLPGKRKKNLRNRNWNNWKLCTGWSVGSSHETVSTELEVTINCTIDWQFEVPGIQLIKDRKNKLVRRNCSLSLTKLRMRRSCHDVSQRISCRGHCSIIGAFG